MTDSMPSEEQVKSYIEDLPWQADVDLERADTMEEQGAPAWAFCYRLAIMAAKKLHEQITAITGDVK